MNLVDVDCVLEAYERIAELGAAAHPDEACGVLIGHLDGGRATVVDATSGNNLNTERSRDRYLLDPEEIVRADREARQRGLDIVGFWHSHPDHPAQPSQFDTDHAWLDYVYVIVNTTAQGAGDLNAFTLREDESVFDPLQLTVVPAPAHRR